MFFVKLTYLVLNKNKKWYNNNGGFMDMVFKDTRINYIRYGNKKKNTIVLLHGWGQNIEMMKPLGDARQEENDIVIIDLPGFGNSEEPKYAWSLNDYVECIKELLDKLNIKKPILIGHSFGGKISLLYASIYDVKKLVLFGSPYKKEIKKESMKLKLLKKAKKMVKNETLVNLAKKHIGSRDYKDSSPIMREILVNHVNYDITEKVKDIKCPTLIIWGDMDSEVSVETAYELENLINDAAVIIYENCTHYAYLERLNQTINILNSFL